MTYIHPEKLMEIRKVDLLSYLKTFEPENLVRFSSGVYCTREHDSLKNNLEKDNIIKSNNEARWYVVHTYSGHENKVKVNIEKLVENRGMQDLVLEIVVPTESCVEFKDNKKRVKTRKMFPGYVIIKMIVTNESWYLVRNTQGITGFVGHGTNPTQ